MDLPADLLCDTTTTTQVATAMQLAITDAPCAEGGREVGCALFGQYAFVTISSSAGNSVMTSTPVAVTTTSSSIRAADFPSTAGQ